jgi:hypothetical protein
MDAKYFGDYLEMRSYITAVAKIWFCKKCHCWVMTTVGRCVFYMVSVESM